MGEQCLKGRTCFSPPLAPIFNCSVSNAKQLSPGQLRRTHMAVERDELELTLYGVGRGRKTTFSIPSTSRRVRECGHRFYAALMRGGCASTLFVHSKHDISGHCTLYATFSSHTPIYSDGGLRDPHLPPDQASAKRADHPYVTAGPVFDTTY